MSSKRLKIMHSNGKLLGLKLVHINLCKSCIFGKQRRDRFKKVGRTPKEVKVELVYTKIFKDILLFHQLVEGFIL